MNKNTIHILSCSRMFFSQEEAVHLAKQYKMTSSPIISDMSIVFMNGFAKDFQNLWTDKRDGYYFLRGECDNNQWSSVLYKSVSTYGANKT